MDQAEMKRVAEATRELLLEALQSAYEEAGQSGLCAEGRWELALDRAGNLDLEQALSRKGVLAADGRE